MTEPVVVVAWLVVAHLVADFVLQTERIAVDKQGNGPDAWRALRDHTIGVAVAVIPVMVAFGVPGVVFGVIVALSHGVIDRTKIVLNRRAETRALDAALARYGTLAGSGGLGTAWTPVPAALFVIDQLVHALVTVAAWAILLRTAPLTGVWSDTVAAVVGGVDPATVRAVGLDAAVGIALVIVNVRAASLLIGTLVSPRETTLGEPPVEPEEAGSREPTPMDRPGSPETARERPMVVSSVAAGGSERGSIVRLRVGPVEIRSSTAVEAIADPVGREDGPHQEAAAPEEPVVPTPASLGPARIGEAIGVLERLLVVVFVLTGALTAIGFVVAAKTLARFKQLDDRAFAEYYLLGTLASVSVALGSSLLAAIALGLNPI